MPDCLFCKIVRSEIPSHKVYEDEQTFAFLDINPVNPGHTLVVPKKHAQDVLEIKDDQWNAVMQTVRRVAHALEKSLNPSGINLGMNNKSGAGQTVFHAHVHIMPRFPIDGHEMWKGHPYASGEAERILQTIKNKLTSL